VVTLAKASKILSTIQNVSESLQEAENIKSIAEEVSKRLALFNLKTTEEEELEDYFDNEVGERNFGPKYCRDRWIWNIKF